MRPDFRVGSDGAAHYTGESASAEPSRAIAPIEQRPTAVAVEPPPPSLSLPEETPKVATRARRVLPPPTGEDAPKKRRGRPRKAVAEGEEAAPKPKRTRKKAVAEGETPE